MTIVLLVFSTTLAAQTNTGEISGQVRDVQGGALPGARVIAEHVDSGVRVDTHQTKPVAITCCRCESGCT